MRCPFCSFLEDRVVDSRLCQDGRAIRRRRECLNCQHRFTTYETFERPNIMVVKKDGCKELFDRQKIIKGVTRACEKRPVSPDKIEEMATTIEQYIENNNLREIPSKVIGEHIMDTLQALDEVAYVRYASVYKRFTDITQFMNTILTLLSDKKA